MAHDNWSALKAGSGNVQSLLRQAKCSTFIEREGRKMRVAILGGSFNPITNAHLNVACEIVHSKLADEVWIVPCGPRSDKPSLITSTLDRLIMCHLAQYFGHLATHIPSGAVTHFLKSYHAFVQGRWTYLNAHHSTFTRYVETTLNFHIMGEQCE